MNSFNSFAVGFVHSQLVHQYLGDDMHYIVKHGKE